MIRRPDQPEKTTAYQTIFRAEMNHLKRAVGGQRKQLRRVFVWPIVFIALIAFVWRVIDTIPQEPSLILWLLNKFNFAEMNYYFPGGLNEKLVPIVLLFPLGVVIWDLWLMSKTLVMSTNSIARERNGNNWELLLLTGVTTRQIIRAKWSAVLHQQWKDYALLAMMRIGAVSVLAMSFDVYFYFGFPPSFGYGNPGPVVEPHITTVILIAISIVLVSAVLMAALTMLNLMFTAACGMLGGILTKRASFALAYGIGVRLLLVIVIAMLAGLPGYLGLKTDIETFGYYPDPVFSTFSLIFFLLGLTMVDNGSFAAGLLMRFGYNFRWRSTFDGFEFFLNTLRGHGPAFFSALLLSIAIGAVLTYVLLRQAARLSARQSLE